MRLPVFGVGIACLWRNVQRAIGRCQDLNLRGRACEMFMSYSLRRVQFVFMTFTNCLSAATLLVVASLMATPAAAKQECLSARDSREMVATNHLLEPLQVMKNLTSLSRSEPVSIKLCRWDATYIYDVTLLHRDGKLLRVFVDAISGKTVNPKPE